MDLLSAPSTGTIRDRGITMYYVCIRINEPTWLARAYALRVSAGGFVWRGFARAGNVKITFLPPKSNYVKNVSA